MIKLKNGTLLSVFFHPESIDNMENLVKDVEKLLDDIENHPEVFEEGFSMSL